MTIYDQIQSAAPFSFLFIRHGETEQNLNRIRCGGDCDVPLATSGFAQISAVGDHLSNKSHDIGVIICSDLFRTRQTAQILLHQLGPLPLRIEPLFNERSLGAWNGLTVEATEPLLVAQESPPGGESEDEYFMRIEQAFGGIIDALPQRPLIVGSRGTARMLCKILGGQIRLNLKNSAVVEFTLFRNSDDGVSQLEITPVL